MDRKQFKRALRAEAARGVPAGVNLWPRIGERAADRRRSRWLPASPEGRIVLAVLAVVLALSAISLAGPRALQWLAHAGWQPGHAVTAADNQGLPRSQTLGEATVTVNSVYATATYLFVGFNLRGARGQNFAPQVEGAGAAPEMRLAVGGRLLPAVAGWNQAGPSPSRPAMTYAAQPGDYAWHFTAPQVLTVPQTLQLQFTLYAQEVIPPATPGQAASRGPAIGPFVFDLAVPVVPSGLETTPRP